MRKSNGVMKELNKLYPDKIVSNLKMMNEELYKNLSEYAKEAKKTLKTFLEEIGYQYVRKPIGQMFAEDYIDLLKAFPEKNIDFLYEKGSKLYYRLLNHAKIKDYSLKQYLNFLGFDYELYKEEIDLSDIKKELEATYKNKMITKLSVTNPILYAKIYKYAQKENMTIKELIKSLGFNIKDNESDTNNKTKKTESNKTEKNEKNEKKNNKTKETKKPDNKKNETTEVKNEGKQKRKVGRPPKNKEDKSEKPNNKSEKSNKEIKNENTNASFSEEIEHS